MSFIGVGVAVAGVAVSAYSAVKSNSNQKKSLDYQMTAAEMQAAYERDLQTTLSFQDWSSKQTANYQEFRKSIASNNSTMYMGAAILVTVAGFGLLYMMTKKTDNGNS